MSVVRQAVRREDRLAVMAVAHAATRPEEPIEYFQARRMAHPKRALGTWWLLEDGGEPVSSLVCYPLHFAVNGTVVEGHGLGAVSTRPEARRRGHAMELCRHAIEAAERAGARIGLLYSAIPPAYYGRLGYRAAPAWHHVCDRLPELAASGPNARLLPLDPYRERGVLVALYERHHGAALHIHRDDARFARSVSFAPEDLFLGVGDTPSGYVRLALEPDAVEVVEEIVPEPERAAVLRAVAHLASRTGRKTVEGWFPPCATLDSFFTDKGRATTLPMIRGHTGLASSCFWPSDYF